MDKKIKELNDKYIGKKIGITASCFIYSIVSYYFFK